MKKYEKEFKVEAVRLAREIGATKAASSLGVPEGTLNNWLYRIGKGGVKISGEKVIPKTPEEIRLLKRVHELEEANEILQGALAFFAERRKK